MFQSCGYCITIFRFTPILNSIICLLVIPKVILHCVSSYPATVCGFQLSIEIIFIFYNVIERGVAFVVTRYKSVVPKESTSHYNVTNFVSLDTQTLVSSGQILIPHELLFAIICVVATKYTF